MKVTLNLASQRYLNRRAFNQLGLLLILLLLVLLVFQVRGYLLSREEIAIYQKYIGELEEKYQQLQVAQPRRLSPEQIEKQKQQFQQADVLLKRDAFRWTALFDRMESSLPAGVSMTSFSPDYQRKSLTMVGVARDLSDLQKLLNNLNADSFKQVFLQNQSLVEVDDGMGGKKTALSFTISLEGVF